MTKILDGSNGLQKVLKHSSGQTTAAIKLCRHDEPAATYPMGQGKCYRSTYRRVADLWSAAVVVKKHRPSKAVHYSSNNIVPLIDLKVVTFLTCEILYENLTLPESISLK